MAEQLEWDRREFLARATAAIAGAAAPVHLIAQAPREPYSQATAPEVITGGIRGLLEGQTARPLRYVPEGTDFVARNGVLFFNRPVYGPISSFRVDAGDLPEFSLYLPGHGGNLKLGVVTEGGAKWFAQAAEVVARYRPGRMIYEIADPLLRLGRVHLELLTAAEGSAMMLQVRADGVPPGRTLVWAFAGVSGRKGDRNGDIGCEKQPITQFFQVRPEECQGNVYSLAPMANAVRECSVRSPFCELKLVFPPDAELAVADFSVWNAAPLVRRTSDAKARLPILSGSMPLNAKPAIFAIERIDGQTDTLKADLATQFAQRSREVENLAGRLSVSSPDSFLNAIGPAISVAAEGLWDARQQCVMHGDVAWRVALAGWRGPYSLDALGHHERAKQHFRHWLSKQNVAPVGGSGPATGPSDPKSHLARKEGLLHSNGDLSGNHYDMNMVFFDVLLRHLRWTGDMDFAAEIWPAYERHLAWEQRLFRRMYASKGGRELPLYEAYAVIWASDNLQYNGGGASHSSAYNLFSFRQAAMLARALGKDAAPYEAESRLLEAGMEEHLWIPGQGAYAESKDLLGPQTVYNNPAAWTVYHTLDSEVPDPRQAWQMVAERLSALRKIPVHGAGVPEGGWYMLSCSDWLPYVWSLNLLVLAENIHTAVAMWQAGMADEAYRLFKGNLLDSMYMGQCPGDFHMTSALDAHRQEAQRDFGDPIGITTRALIEGLYGFQPDLLQGKLTVRPGFPSDWKHASLRHPDFDFGWQLDGMTERYTVTSRLPKTVPATFRLRARTTDLPAVMLDGKRVPCSFDPSAVGVPALRIDLPAAPSWTFTVAWKGEAPANPGKTLHVELGDALPLPHGVTLAQIDDPQACLRAGKIAAAGFHTVFAKMRQGECAWALPISFYSKDPALQFVAAPSARAGAALEPLDLSPILKDHLVEIFSRDYAEPRSPFCSLAIPSQLQGGWANFNMESVIDDAGLRAAGGTLMTGLGVPFRTPGGRAPNCRFLSHWKLDQAAVEVPLSGRATGAYLLMTGSTLPQTSRMEHGAVTVRYVDGSTARLSLRNPETWWPIEQDYLLDDSLFVNEAPLPPRVDLRTGKTRLLDAASFKGRGRTVPGGAATVLYLPLDHGKPLQSMEVRADLYGIVVALLGVTLAGRSEA